MLTAAQAQALLDDPRMVLVNHTLVASCDDQVFQIDRSVKFLLRIDNKDGRDVVVSLSYRPE